MNIDKIKTQKILEGKAELLRAIAHPVRLCILTKLIFDGASNVTNMQNCLNVPQSTVSQHLAKLRSAGVVEKTRNGLEIHYELKNQDVRKILEILLNINEGVTFNG